MSIERFWKVIGKNREPCHGGSGQWKRVGTWMPPIENIKPCCRGYHLCRDQDLVRWLDSCIYLAEWRGRCIESPDKMVVSEARLVRRVKTWNERTQRLFACDCAERVVGLNGDKRLRQVIQTARRFAMGKATKNELAAAWAAAWAAGNAAWAAGAARAARAAAWAAGDAAWAAGDAWAATAAARAAGDAARAAGDAARAAGDAGDKERRWQTKRLLRYLDADKYEVAEIKP